MSPREKIRAIAAAAILATAATGVFALNRGEFQPSPSVSVVDLGAMTVVAQRISDRQIVSTRGEITLLGSMTISAPRLPTGMVNKPNPTPSVHLATVSAP